MPNEYLEDYIEVEDCAGIGETQMAVKVIRHDTGMMFWVPKSVIHDDSEVWKTFTEGNLIVTKWWAEKRGLV